jgi:hypothetical protein
MNEAKLSEQPIEMCVQLTKKDYINFNLTHLYKSKWTLGLIAIFVFLPLIVLLPLSGWAVKELVFPIIICSGFLLSILSIVIKAVKNHEVYSNPTNYLLDQDGVRIESTFVKAHYPWSKIQKARKISEFHGLFLNSTSVVILPKNSFSHPEDYEYFVELLNHYNIPTNTHRSKVMLNAILIFGYLLALLLIVGLIAVQS